MTQRDPRVNPRSGDVLRKGASTVEVTTVTYGFGFRFFGQSKDMPPMPEWDKPWKRAWRKWAKDATVEKVAP
jgi:hypothetical protein